MHIGKLVFAQIMEHLPLTTFRRGVARYGSEHKIKTLSCLDQYLCMAFAQLTSRERLRDIEACLRAQEGKLYHMDIRGSVARKTLAHANAVRVSDGTLHDVNVLDLLVPEPGAFYVMDRGYLDFERLHRLHDAGSFFVTRAQSNLNAQRRYSHPVDRSTGLMCDQTIVLTGLYAHQDFATPLRRIRFKDPVTGKRLVFPTNNFALPALTITELSRCRWQVELLFTWITPHLRIKVFFGTSENAVKTQIRIAVSVDVLVAIVTKRLNLSASVYAMRQIVSLTVFERIPLDQLLYNISTDDMQTLSANQLNLFD
jgi:hypothetical protein